MTIGDKDLALEKALARMHLGRSLLFVGAGFSRAASTAHTASLLSASELARHIAEEISEQPDQLTEISELFLARKGAGDLINLLKRNFSNTTPTPAQKLVVKQPWARIYTTNYDDVIERCFSSSEERPPILTRTNHPKELKGNSNSIIHLNGYINRVDASNLDQEILLTDYQYLTNELKMSPWSIKLRADMMLSDSIFFVGYSLYDFDVAKILLDKSISGKAIFFIQHEAATPAQLNKLERFGLVYNFGIEEFSRQLSCRTDVTSLQESMGFFINLKEILLDFDSVVQPGDEKVFDLLFKGDVDYQGLLWDLTHDKDDYFVSREMIAAAKNALETPSSVVFVHGDIGNGKRLFTEDILVRLSVSGGYKTFVYEAISSEMSDDIEMLNKIEGPIVVIVKDVYTNFEIINLLRSSISDIRIVTTSRTAVYQLRSLPINVLKKEDLFVFSLDVLSDDEVVRLSKFLTKFGFWGTLSGYDDTMKIDFITNKCNRQLRSLLLDLFDQKFVTDQIGAIVAESKAGSGDSFCYLIKLLALSAAEFDMPFKSIAEVFGTKFANDFVQQRFSWQREFFHNAHGRQTIKSVLLAIFLLRKFVNDRDIIDNVAELCFTVDQMSEVNPIYRKKVSRLLRYGFIERLLDDEGKREKLVRFYEAVRQYGVGGRNPQFWLQYAIARMSFRDYEAAGAYFDTAFALAEGFRDYDDYMISTHYARFLLESRVNGNSYTDFAENFFAVHDEIMRQSGRLNSAHYPYRIATQYLSYLQAKADDFSQQDIERAKTCCLELLSRIDSLTPELKLNRYVVRCKRCMTESLEFLAAFDE